MVLVKSWHGIGGGGGGKLSLSPLITCYIYNHLFERPLDKSQHLSISSHLVNTLLSLGIRARLKTGVW